MCSPMTIHKVYISRLASLPRPDRSVFCIDFCGPAIRESPVIRLSVVSLWNADVTEPQVNCVMRELSVNFLLSLVTDYLHDNILLLQPTYRCAAAMSINNCMFVGLLNTTLSEWISEHAVRAYTTPDSALSYLNHNCIIAILMVSYIRK